MQPPGTADVVAQQQQVDVLARLTIGYVAREPLIDCLMACRNRFPNRGGEVRLFAVDDARPDPAVLHTGLCVVGCCHDSRRLLRQEVNSQ